MKNIEKIVIILFLLLMPYVIIKITGFHADTPALMEIQEELTDTVYYVARQETYGICFVPMEEYLIGLTAANIPMEYEDETVKAQITILRSIILHFADEKGENKMNNQKYIFCREDEIGLSYYSNTKLKQIWDEEYETNFQRIANLILETKGIYLSYQDSPIDAPFCLISAGKTRDGSDLYPYLYAVSSEDDIFADNYVTRLTFQRDEWQELLLTNVPDLVGEDIFDIEILNKDSSDYVTLIRLGNKQMNGEAFRILCGAPSACYSIECDENEITLTSNGIGHGYGMSQYFANQMAIDGNDFREILGYFFSAIEIKKIE